MSNSKRKYSVEQIKKLPPDFLLKVIEKAKKFIVKDKTFIKMCEDYGVEPVIIQHIPMYFDDLDVSATTKHGVIYFNYKLLCDGDFFKDFMYVIHELGHILQQYFNDEPTKGADDGEYLENEYEIEAFQNQVEFMHEHFGKSEVEKYINNLLDYHDLDDHEFDDKKQELLKNIEER